MMASRGQRGGAPGSALRPGLRRRPALEFPTGGQDVLLPEGTPARLVLGLAMLLLIFTSLAGPARAQINWLNFEDGDILNVSAADGPPPGWPFIQARRSVEHSTLRGSVVLNRLQFQYGVTSFLSCGASVTHLRQEFRGLHKQGPGDTDLSCKVHFRPFASLPLRIGLRQSLSLPTGYEMERSELVGFTSRKNDYSAQVLMHYQNPIFSACINPGILLPGGNAASHWTAGLGLAFFLPLRLDLRGEYYTRYNMVSHQSDPTVFLGGRWFPVDHIALDLGMKRRLLQGEQVDPEWQLGIGFGQPRHPPGQLFEIRPPRSTHIGLLIHPIETMAPDPFGVARHLAEVFRAERRGDEEMLAVFVPSTPAEPLSALANLRHYELNVRILQINEGEISGVEVPLLGRAAQSTTEIVAQAELIAPDGYSVLRRAVYRGVAHKGMGIELIPDSGSVEAKVAPSEIRDALRRAAVADLAHRILIDSIAYMSERDAQ